MQEASIRRPGTRRYRRPCREEEVGTYRLRGLGVLVEENRRAVGDDVRLRPVLPARNRSVLLQFTNGKHKLNAHVAPLFFGVQHLCEVEPICSWCLE